MLRISANGFFALGAFDISSNKALQWSAGVAGSSSVDTGFSRLSAGYSRSVTYGERYEWHARGCEHGGTTSPFANFPSPGAIPRLRSSARTRSPDSPAI